MAMVASLSILHHELAKEAIMHGCIVHGPGDVDRFETLPMDDGVAEQVLEAAKVQLCKDEEKMLAQAMQYFVECRISDRLLV